MALVVRIKPRAERQIDGAAAWWSENRPAAPGAIREDLKNALEALVEQPTKFELVINLKTARARPDDSAERAFTRRRVIE